MNGMHFTLIGAIATIAIAYWLIKYSNGVYTIGTEGTKAIANIPRAWTKGTGAP